MKTIIMLCKLFWITLVAYAMAVTNNEDDLTIQYEVLLKEIDDPYFTDTIIKAPLLKFFYLEKSTWRTARLIDRIGAVRPKLLVELDEALARARQKSA